RNLTTLAMRSSWWMPSAFCNAGIMAFQASPASRTCTASLGVADEALVRSLAPLHPRRRALAVAWLTGTVDDQVAVPIGFVCDALGLDAGALAAAVQARATP